MMTLNTIQARLDGIAAACARHHGIPELWFLWHPGVREAITDRDFVYAGKGPQRAIQTAHVCVLEMFSALDVEQIERQPKKGSDESYMSGLTWVGNSNRASNHHTLAAFAQFQHVFASA